MSDPVTTAARAAAQKLEAEAGPWLVADVDAALAAQESSSHPQQFVDPVSLASLIVSIANLAWTVYIDLRKRTVRPTADMVTRTVRVRLHDDGQAVSDHVVEVVVTEVISAGTDQESNA